MKRDLDVAFVTALTKALAVEQGPEVTLYSIPSKCSACCVTL
jgi:hypothetical protein